MKKLASIITLIVFAFAWSCGGGSETKKEATVDTTKKAEKSYDLKTKEGMLKKIQDFNISIPEEMTFVEVKKKSSSYAAIFEASNLDEPSIEQLQNWYKKEMQELTNEGWRPRPLRENDEMMGFIFNQTIFYKDIEGTRVTDAIDFSTQLNPKENTFKVTISYEEVY